MRILGWLLLIGGFLLCASILWAAPGFLCLAFGLIFLQIAERKRLRVRTAASPSEPPIEPPPLHEPTRAVVPPKADEKKREERKDRGNAAGPHSYDEQKWRALLSSDADVARVAAALALYGQQYVDQLATAYLLLNDKEYLPKILGEIVRGARQDGGPASDHPDNHTEAGPEQERVSELPEQKSACDVEMSAARETAPEETDLQPPATIGHRESNASAPRQSADQETNPASPAVPVAAASPDEKRARDVDADNPTDMLNRPSQELSTKPE
jgi:hypothetical protein